MTGFLSRLCYVLILSISILFIINMKLITLVILAAILGLATSIPHTSQIALANSLQVGRNQNPMDWTCADCDDSNKPLSSVIIENKRKDVKSIMSVYQDYTVLAFRYTATIKNVFQDLLWAIQTQDENSCQGCKVQKQMDNMWNTIRSDVLAGLRENAHTGKLIITGISLGGALSCLSYVDIIKAQIFDDVEIITFGAPRVGNRKWANWFDYLTSSATYWRYFIARDPIAFLPRCLSPFCNYKQTGQSIRCNKGDQTCTFRNRAGEQEQIEENQITQFLNEAKSISEHITEDDDNVDSIIDHIYGYKKIYNYTLVQ